MRTLDRTSKIVRGGLGVLVATSLAAGCGDDGDGGGDVTTGLPPTKLLSDVTEAEAQSACTQLRTGFNRVFDRSKLIRAICTLSGAVVADTTAECVTFRDDCIEQGNMSGSAAMRWRSTIRASRTTSVSPGSTRLIERKIVSRPQVN